ncbi:MAG: hypothetical protein ABIP55_03205, partial [Tepidisphaeraceae bacterium]
MRPWTRRILLALAILIAVVLIVTQVVLWTDYPRRRVLALVQQQLGLRVEAASMSTSWLGNTTLHDVKLSLPLAEESFFEIPTMRIEHTALIPLALTRQFELDALTLEKPTLIVRRDQAGRWNAQDVIELLAKATTGKPEPGTKEKPPKLPRLRLADGTIRVIEFDGRSATIAPLNVSGYRDGPLVYRYDAIVAEQLKVVGLVAPGEGWKHELNINAKPAAWIAPWLGHAPDPLLLNGQWTGVINRGALVGRLIVEEGKYEAYTARGRVAVQVGTSDAAGSGGGTSDGGSDSRSAAGASEAVILSPQDLIITTPSAAAPTVQIASGNVRIEGWTINLDQLRLTGLGGQAQVDGSANLASRSAELSAQWLDVTTPGPTLQNGHLALTIKEPFPGRPEVDATLTTRGRTPRGDWEGEIHLTGHSLEPAVRKSALAGNIASRPATSSVPDAGLPDRTSAHRASADRALPDMDWVATLSRATWDGKTDLNLQNFTLRLAQRDNLLRLADVDWPGHQVAAQGQYNFTDKNWSLRFDGRDTLKTSFDFNVRAEGDAHFYRLQQLTLRAREAELKIHGTFDRRRPEPVSLTVYLTHLPESLLPEGPDAPPLRGLLIAEAQLKGTTEPVLLNLTGSLRGRKLVAFERNLGDIQGDLTGRITGDPDGLAGEFTVKDCTLLGGKWHAHGVWPARVEEGGPWTVDGGQSSSARSTVYRPPSAPTNAPLRITVGVKNLAMKEIGELLKTKDVTGVANGSFVLDVPLPLRRREDIAMRGDFTADNVSTAHLPHNALSAQRIAGDFSLRNGVFRADPITLHKEEGGAKGTATVSIQTTLARLKNPDINLIAEAWPVRLSETGSAAIWAQTLLSIAPVSASAAKDATRGVAPHVTPGAPMGATGPMTIRAKFATTAQGEQQAISELIVEGKLDGRRGVFETITLDALGGHAQGRAALNADAPNQTNATLSWTGIRGERLADFFPALEGLTGSYAGALAIGPASSPRAVEPLRVTLGIDPDGEKNGGSDGVGSDGVKAKATNNSVTPRFRTIALGPARLSAFLNLNDRFALERLV